MDGLRGGVEMLGGEEGATVFDWKIAAVLGVIKGIRSSAFCLVLCSFMEALTSLRSEDASCAEATLLSLCGERDVLDSDIAGYPAMREVEGAIGEIERRWSRARRATYLDM